MVGEPDERPRLLPRAPSPEAVRVPSGGRAAPGGQALLAPRGSRKVRRPSAGSQAQSLNTWMMPI